MNAHLLYPPPHNEPIFGYEKGSPQRLRLLETYKSLYNHVADIPMFIGGEEIRTGKIHRLSPPHDHKHTIGHYHKGTAEHVTSAIEASLSAKRDWERMRPEDRAAIFLKAAELASGPYRYKLNAATMLAQSKTPFQAEIDAVCEFVDFLRFNVRYMAQIYGIQPDSALGIRNHLEYRPLEGFVFAITPFNFTAIAGNLPSSAALMGNTVVWKPADSQIYSAHVVMEIFREAGLPAGVINLIFTEGPEAGDVIFNHPDFAGLHFTGSTGVFKALWKQIGQNIDRYKSYPRIVGETGGKDFVIAHPSAEPASVATALSRGAFEFQGQKCSAASRAYLPKSLSIPILEHLVADVKSFKMGSPDNMENFITAVIDERAFDKIASYLDYVKQSTDAEILVGGNYDKNNGYFIEPTVILTSNPHYRTMCEEIFGPVLTVFIYPDDQWTETLHLLDQTSEYSLTGSVFAKDRQAIIEASDILRHSAGNFYINDKPTGAVVNQQPFGGGRASGTNDKAGSMFNLLRWVSVRTVKETFVPPTDYRYPFMD
jgi:1-pyrroline-5-carboxylate dehydrogenase